ncbi:hypothetical protein AGMMS49938_14420 [Fibrobacterales bacterium]|nr:hypothetical protein AGMMS49938_14420 [Fibrobacterales bacterium]
MQLTDDLINGAIDSITGFVVAETAEKFDVSLDFAMEKFLNSNTYKLLSDKETGLYFDSIPEILECFWENAFQKAPF